MGEISVLVVDEDAELLELTQTFLQRQDEPISVTTETDATLAADRVADEGIDCVVSDLRMPKMDGVELAEELADSGVDVPFFLFTAAQKDVEESVAAGPITGYVQKGSGTEHYEQLATKIGNAVS